MKLEPTEQRILGVLIEKELAVPDSYPMTENALLAGCNQKSNRDPVMEVEDFQLSGAIAAMLEKGMILRVSLAGSRAVRFKHLAEEKLGVNGREKAVLAELLVRGPQAPGALKPRVARMGMAATPAEILTVLEGLRSRADGALVAQMPRQPRERDQRWRHLLGGAGEPAVAMSEAGQLPLESKPVQSAPIHSQPVHSTPEPSEPPASETPPPDSLQERVRRLEEQVAAIQEELARRREE